MVSKLATVLFGSLLLTSAPAVFACGDHTPAVDITIDGVGARYVQPILVQDDSEKELPLVLADHTYRYEGATPGHYLLTLVDKDKGTVLLEESITVQVNGSQELQGNTRHIGCTFFNKKVECRNYY